MAVPIGLTVTGGVPSVSIGVARAKEGKESQRKDESGSDTNTEHNQEI